ncbi:Crp/Fnr family transcriptional regulator [Pseudalkalibacillus sp. R45]|uniref:Crp/Fnr family transcriptional regulator n=1 Tax=Pseudalkalibacillus sp. R45 TaxID=3457433 RepID=UPI003FCD1F0C
MECIATDLKKLPIFSSLVSESLKKLGDITNKRTYKKRMFVFMEGEEREAVYFIRKGVVKTYHVDEEGNQQVISILHAGDMFPHVGFFDSTPYPATAEVVQDAELLIIRIDDFDKLMMKQPQIGISVMKVMGKKILQLQERVQSLISKDVQHRLIHAILELSIEHGTQNGNSVQISFPVTNQDFANIVGTSRESINRTLNHLKKEKILSCTRSGIQIHDLKKLKQLR